MCLRFDHVIEAIDVTRLNARSPSKLGWRPPVEPTHTRRFETTVTLGTLFGLMNPAAAGPLPSAGRALLRWTRMGGCQTQSLALSLGPITNPPELDSHSPDGWSHWPSQSLLTILQTLAKKGLA